MIESRPAADPGPTGGGVSEFIRFLYRRRAVILAPAIVVTATTWLGVVAIPPLYSAQAALALDARKVQIVEHEVVSGLSQESPVVRTELDVIASRSLVERVIDRLGLEHDPGFMREVEAPPPWLVGKAQRLLASLLSISGGAGPAATNSAEPRPSRAQLVDWIIDHLSVSNDGRSFTIIVSFTSDDPKRAAKITNSIAEQYLADQVNAKTNATVNANKWLHDKLVDLSPQLETSEETVDDFRRQSGLIGTKGTAIPIQRLDGLNSQIVIARAELAQAEAKYAAAQAGDPAIAPDVIASPVIQHLRREIAQNEAEIAADKYNTLAYKEDVLNVRAAALQKHMSLERNRILASLRSQVQAARERVAGLTRSFQTAKQELGATTGSARRLAQLQREADANLSVYENFLARYKQTMEQEGLAAPDAGLISRADIPRFPSYPKKLQLLVLGAFAGLAAGLGLGYVREGFDRRLLRVSDVGAVTGIPVFGLLPTVPRWRLLPPQDYPVSKPGSRFCSSLARIYAVLQASGSPVRARSRIILVTSAKSGEGKTSFCASLARSLAKNYKRVLVIDADPYRRRVASAFGAGTVPAFGPLADQPGPLGRLVGTDLKSGAQFIPAPTKDEWPLLLHTGEFAARIEKARRAYDVVIIDTPPVLTSADAALIGKFADTCLLLVRWGRASWDDVTSAAGYLRLCGIIPDGIVMVGADGQPAHYGPVGSHGGYGSLTPDRGAAESGAPAASYARLAESP
jgi:uncharacterized protein involved in exopolysaccharide biosynthesis